MPVEGAQDLLVLELDRIVRFDAPRSWAERSSSTPVWLAHYREDSSEVDMVIETYDGRVFGLEIKLTANPGEGSLKGLRRLAGSCGNRFAGGVVLARVPAGRPAAHGLTIAPLDAVWDVAD